jgi:hypothetical protein
MSNNLEPKKNDRLEKPFEPDLNKGGTSSAAPIKPQVPLPPPADPKKS